MKSLPAEKLSKTLCDFVFTEHGLPEEKTLGLVWYPESDEFGCRMTIRDHPNTLRGILKTLFSIFDPLFLASPAIIPGKRIFQEACALQVGWDDELPPRLMKKWIRWKEELELLQNFRVPRCFVAGSFVEAELHFYSDGSTTAYGSCCYMRLGGGDGSFHTNIVMACARMTPIGRSSLKSNSMKTPPRIELNACKLSINLKLKIEKELDMPINRIYYWTDSITCLNYIKSDSGRFKTFVANRVDFIRSHSSPTEWNHISGSINPADVLSRGTPVKKFLEDELWLKGPKYLRDPSIDWPVQKYSKEIPPEDEEIIRKSLAVVKVEEPTEDLIVSTSDWLKLKTRVALFKKFFEYLKNKNDVKSNISIADLREAEKSIWRYLQRRHFPIILEKVTKGKRLLKSEFAKLGPYLDSENLLRAEGRLRNSNLPESAKHPLLIPNRCATVEALFRYTHKVVGHLGKENLIATIRKRYYVSGMSSLAYKTTQNCLVCRKILSTPNEQRMADLPSDRLRPDLPAFSSTGIDCFGPVFVTRGRGRAKEKRYGLLLTCMASRAVHIEVLHSLDTDSLVSALRRFHARRGPILRIRCDNGTNFVSGQKEIASGMKQWNDRQVHNWCKHQEIEWLFNVPASPHWGGAWEREIRTCKKILTSMTSELENKKPLTDEALVTWLCEVEDIMNNRPMTQVTCDLDDKQPLTPNHLLKPVTEKTFPPGLFSKSDVYAKRRWKQIQFLADEFWTRWQREYLPLLMSRQKWAHGRRNLSVGDLVLVVDQILPRNMWCTGVVETVRHDREGRVRSAGVLVSKHRADRDLHIGTHRLERPITKLILLKTNEDLHKGNTPS